MVDRSIEKLLFSSGLPAALDVERFVLGSILLDDAKFAEQRGLLTPEHFTLDAHRRIYAAMVNLYEAGAHLDRVTVGTALANAGQLESVGGLSYIASLDEGMPALPNLDSYFGILEQKRAARGIIQACFTAVERAMANEPADTVAADCEAALKGLSAEGPGRQKLRAAGDVIAEIGIEQFLAPAQNDPGAVPVALPSLARYVPVLRPGQLIVIAGGTGRGKTALGGQLCHSAARSGIGVGVFSLEMAATDVLRRMVVGAAGVDGHKLTLGKLTNAERTRLQESTAELSELPFYIDDSAGRTVPAISASLRKLQSARKLGLVMVDYLGLLQGAGRHENRTQEISSISRGLKLLAVERALPLIALAQINRQGATEVPDLHHLRDSGSIEQDADVVLMIHAPKEIEDPNQPMIPVRLLIRKHRGGPVGSCEVLFDRRYTKFVEKCDAD